MSKFTHHIFHILSISSCITEPVLCLRRGAIDSPHYMLSLRQLVVDNGVASPFQQVLAWLAKRKNFFTATGIALDLLQDADTLFYLWKHAEMINEEDEEMKLIGLLDGIIPVRFLDENGTSTPCRRSVTAVHLSEMTVGCFIKGGAAMSKSLIRFLEKNKSYDPSRVSLMLAFATVNEIVDDQESEETAKREKHQDIYFDELLWPIKCLLEVGTTRDYLPEAFALLNNTIPDELRHRLHHHGDDGLEEEKEKISSSESTPSMKLTKKLVELIVESDPVAIDILMSFADDRSQGHYWQSLDHETRLNLSLMKADSHSPFLRHPEVRTWARGQLDLCFKENTQSVLPTSWLQELSVACLHNAECELKNLEIVDDTNIDEHLLLSSTLSDISEKTYVTGSVVNTGIATTDLGRSINSGMDDKDGVYKLNFEIEKTRNALLPPTDDSYSLDYDLLVPTLLLLQYRNAHWHPSSSSSSLSIDYISTQPLLDAACYQAGRTTTPVSISGGGRRIAAHHRTAILTSRIMRDRTDDEPFLFAAFDDKCAMKQCFQANNIVAGANLIGGTNGFILQVCYILTEGLGISVNDAESFLLNDALDVQIAEQSKMEMVSFELTSRHRILLLLLDEHVLSIKTFGDFDSIHNRGRVDPVFAARSILRAWLSLSYGDKSNSSNWLGDWLARRLEIRSGVASSSLSPSPNTARVFVDEHEDTKASAGSNNNNKHRLACASLARSLLWPNNSATPKTTATTVDNDDDSKDNVGKGSGESSTMVPLAISMKFEKQLLIQLCQSCLGLVESVPQNALGGMNNV
jgi:hypothetical protein